MSADPSHAIVSQEELHLAVISLQADLVGLQLRNLPLLAAELVLLSAQQPLQLPQPCRRHLLTGARRGKMPGGSAGGGCVLCRRRTGG